MSALVGQWLLCAHRFGHCTDTQYAAFHIGFDGLVEKINLKIRYWISRRVANLAHYDSAGCHLPRNRSPTYPGAIDKVIYPLELFNRSVYHRLHALLVRDIHLDGDSAMFRMFRELLAVFRGRFNPVLIDIRKYDADSASFGKCVSGLFADTSGSLTPIKSSIGNMSSRK